MSTLAFLVNVISFKKILVLIGVISFIQMLGFQITKLLGAKRGAVITGLFAGLVSSTATVVTTARASKEDLQGISSQILTFIAATVAMQVVCVTIVILGTKDIHYSLFLIILAPVLSALVMLYFEARTYKRHDLIMESEKFKFSHVLKLAAFIVGTIFISKLTLIFFPNSGISILTFIVSLFEMHGSVVANLQLHDAGTFSLKELGGLIAISILASYLSKLFFVFTLGSRPLKVKVLRYTLISLLFLGLGWLLFENCPKGM